MVKSPFSKFNLALNGRKLTLFGVSGYEKNDKWYIKKQKMIKNIEKYSAAEEIEAGIFSCDTHKAKIAFVNPETCLRLYLENKITLLDVHTADITPESITFSRIEFDAILIDVMLTEDITLDFVIMDENRNPL